MGYVAIITLYVPMGAPPHGPEARMGQIAENTRAWWAILGLSVVTDVLFLPLAMSLYAALRQFHRNAMLLAAIVYAARCKDDRPVTRVVSGFKTRKRSVMPREKGKAGLGSEQGLQTWFDGPVLVELADLAEDARRTRFEELLPFLAANDSRRFEVDAVLRAWGVGNRDRAFFARCEQALGAGGDDAAKARTLLARYAPEGPGATATAEAWTKWIAEHRDYVFFSDVAGYRWVVDPLAKKRGVPAAQLRGAARVAPAAEQGR